MDMGQIMRWRTEWKTDVEVSNDTPGLAGMPTISPVPKCGLLVNHHHLMQGLRTSLVIHQTT